MKLPSFFKFSAVTLAIVLSAQAQAQNNQNTNQTTNQQTNQPVYDSDRNRAGGNTLAWVSSVAGDLFRCVPGKPNGCGKHRYIGCHRERQHT